MKAKTKVSIFNRYYEGEKERWQKKLLFVFWEGSRGVSLKRGWGTFKGTMDTSDRVRLVIPYDGNNHEAFVMPKEFKRLCDEERAGKWTIAPEDKIVYGNCELDDADDVFTVTEVIRYDDVGVKKLRHWEVFGC